MEASLTQHIKDLKDLDEKQQKQAIKVWRQLSFYIITHMKRGYFEFLTKTDKNPSTMLNATSDSDRHSITLSLS